MTSPNPVRDEEGRERPRIEPLLKDGDVVERLKQFRMRWQESGDLTYLGKALVDAIVEIEAARKASAPVPASGGVDAVAEACAQAAEGPEYWPHPKQPGDVLTYRGTKDGNWLAVKPPFKLDPYSQGRADAAAAVRALSPAATPVSESEPVREAAQALIAARSSTYKARNGRVMGIEDDSGEMMWIVPFDEMLALEDALAKPPSSPAGGDVREAAFELLSHLELYEFNERDPSGELYEFTAALKSALSQPTSAGRVGE